jgi:N-acyl-D-aspartate/D-glutamate deacylase
LPSTYAKARELRRLKSQLRRRDRALQSGPDITHPHNIVSQALQSVGFGRPRLKTSLLAAADMKSAPGGMWLTVVLAALANRLGGDFRFQHLPVPFEVYADGIDLVIFEEFGSGAAALHLKTEMERNELIRDEEYRRGFRKDYDSKFGPRAWHRDFFDAEIVGCPDESLQGKSFGDVGVERGGLHPVDAFLDLVLEHGSELRWRTTISNHRPKMLRQLAVKGGIQMGFSDAGAHLRNMAFYNCGLRLLRHVRDAQRQGQEFMSVERAVHRLTGELADWYHLDAGHLRIGDWADIVVIDPARLDSSLDGYHEAQIDAFGGLERMVNRNDATVKAVMVAGRTVFVDGQPTALVGRKRTGSFLRADGRPRNAPVRNESERGTVATV